MWLPYLVGNIRFRALYQKQKKVSLMYRLAAIPVYMLLVYLYRLWNNFEIPISKWMQYKFHWYFSLNYTSISHLWVEKNCTLIWFTVRQILPYMLCLLLWADNTIVIYSDMYTCISLERIDSLLLQETNNYIFTLYHSKVIDLNIKLKISHPYVKWAAHMRNGWKMTLLHFGWI